MLMYVKRETSVHRSRTCVILCRNCLPFSCNPASTTRRTTTIAAVGAVYAIGMRNVKEVWDISRIVIKRLWSIFCLGLDATKATLCR
jgi:hypothetical protein